MTLILFEQIYKQVRNLIKDENDFSELMKSYDKSRRNLINKMFSSIDYYENMPEENRIISYKEIMKIWDV